MPVATDQIVKPKLLIGEGKDEQVFCEALLRHLGLTGVQVGEYGGKDKLADVLYAFPRRPDFPQVVSLGILRDADGDAGGAFQKVCTALRNANLAYPVAHSQGAGASPRVSVFILPDGQNDGMLEDLCLAAVQADPATPCVEEFFTCVQRQSGRQPRIPAKARVQAWLASHLESDLRMGLAAQRGYWPFDAPTFSPLITFVRSL
jgi:hypothetical protein